MNLGQNPTREELRELVFPHQDADGTHLLWADEDGEVHLEVIPSHLTAASYERSLGGKLKFRIEEFGAGEGYTGPAGANDREWMDRLFAALVDSWAANTRGLVSIF